ncbi:MAG: DNA polymerase III subunit delta' [Gammaproteobacteria bacterium]|nr:DNA polymerase III subunit delta' [Gammaproteobacteria bacterium]
MIYPWQARQWQRLADARRHNRLPHALLFSGPPGIGKRHLADTLAQSLLCALPAAADLPCGECKPCCLFLAGSHPDRLLVEPLEPGKAIRIDQIRDLVGFMALSRQYGRWKIVTLDPADCMNRSAANSLLKVLEEPPAGALFLLVTDRPHGLPATVRSRCQRVDVALPAAAEAGQWLAAELGSSADVPALLALARGAPLAARRLAQGDALTARASAAADLRALVSGQQSPVELADRWSAGDVERLLDMLQSFVRDAVIWRMTADAGHMHNADLAPHMQAIANALDLRRLIEFDARAREGARMLRIASGLREQALLDDLLLFLVPTHDERGRKGS